MANHIIAGAIVGCSVLIVGLLLQYLLLPFMRLEAKRREGRGHIPQPEEIWTEDADTMLYIEGVGPGGVELIAVDARTKTPTRWKDTWEQWGLRLQNRVVLFTGAKRPLKAE